MGAWISYTLIAGLVLIALYLVYARYLSADNQPAFNRTVLLWCYATAALAPIAGGALKSAFPDGNGTAEIGNLTATVINDTPASDDSTPILALVIIGIYLIGVLCVTVSTAAAWLRLWQIVRHAAVKDCGSYKIAIISDGRIAPFSWGHYIIMSADDYRENGDMITIHERAHIKHRHCIDLAIARLFEIAMWYNPAAWLMTAQLRAVHEYQADRAVLNSTCDARQYQMLLIKKAVGRSFPVLANSLNHSNLKKRITMMLKPQSSKSRRMRAFALAPAVAVAMLGANIPAVAGVLNSVAGFALPTESSDKSSEFIENVQPAATDAGISAVTADETTDEPALKAAETMPHFPGGEAAMLKFLAENIKFPDSELNRKGRFTVIVKFVVGSNGKVRDAKIMRSQGEAFDNEAIRVVKLMPDFTPGTVNGKPVAVEYVLPVAFSTK